MKKGTSLFHMYQYTLNVIGDVEDLQASLSPVRWVVEVDQIAIRSTTSYPFATMPSREAFQAYQGMLHLLYKIIIGG
jgi:hypothetical protein